MCRRGSLVVRLIARAIISPMRNPTRESSISWLYPATRDTNRFSSSISSPHSSPTEKSRSGLSGKRGIAHRLAPHQRDNILTFVLFPRPWAREDRDFRLSRGAGMVHGGQKLLPRGNYRSVRALPSTQIRSRRQRKAFGLSIQPFNRDPFARPVPWLRSMSGERK